MIWIAKALLIQKNMPFQRIVSRETSKTSAPQSTKNMAAKARTTRSNKTSEEINDTNKALLASWNSQ